MVRATISVITGYLVLAVLVIATDAVLGGLLRAQRDVFTVVNLATALPYAAAGGWIAARVARGKEIAAAIGLPAFALVMGAITLAIDRGRQPLWYWALLLMLMMAGAALGALLRAKQARKLAA